jgi:hypothetical protein
VSSSASLGGFASVGDFNSAASAAFVESVAASLAVTEADVAVTSVSAAARRRLLSGVVVAFSVSSMSAGAASAAALSLQNLDATVLTATLNVALTTRGVNVSCVVQSLAPPAIVLLASPPPPPSPLSVITSPPPPAALLARDDSAAPAAAAGNAGAAAGGVGAAGAVLLLLLLLAAVRRWQRRRRATTAVDFEPAELSRNKAADEQSSAKAAARKGRGLPQRRQELMSQAAAGQLKPAGVTRVQLVFREMSASAITRGAALIDGALAYAPEGVRKHARSHFPGVLGAPSLHIATPLFGAGEDKEEEEAAAVAPSRKELRAGRAHAALETGGRWVDNALFDYCSEDAGR